MGALSCHSDTLLALTKGKALESTVSRNPFMDVGYDEYHLYGFCPLASSKPEVLSTKFGTRFHTN